MLLRYIVHNHVNEFFLKIWPLIDPVPVIKWYQVLKRLPIWLGIFISDRKRFRLLLMRTHRWTVRRICCFINSKNNLISKMNILFSVLLTSVRRFFTGTCKTKFYQKKKARRIRLFSGVVRRRPPQFMSILYHVKLKYARVSRITQKIL